jgi:ribosomal RNA-processing protein 9
MLKQRCHQCCSIRRRSRESLAFFIKHDTKKAKNNCRSSVIPFQYRVPNILEMKRARAHLTRKSTPFHLKQDEVSSGEEDNISNTTIEEDETDDFSESVDARRIRLSKIFVDQVGSLHSVSCEDSEDERSSKRFANHSSAGSVVTEDKWDITSSRHLYGHRGAVTCLCLSNDESFLVSGSKDDSLVFWDTETGDKRQLQRKRLEVVHNNSVLSVAVSSDGRYVACGDTDGRVQIFDPRVKVSNVHTYEGHRGAVTGVSFQSDGSALFSCSSDRCMKYWDMNSMGFVETLFGHQVFLTMFITAPCNSVFVLG